MCLFLCSYCCWLSLWRHCLKSINGRRMPRADERHKNCNMGPLYLLTSLYPWGFVKCHSFYIPLHSTPFRCIPLHSTTLHSISFHCIGWHFRKKGAQSGIDGLCPSSSLCSSSSFSSSPLPLWIFVGLFWAVSLSSAYGADHLHLWAWLIVLTSRQTLHDI